MSLPPTDQAMWSAESLALLHTACGNLRLEITEPRLSQLQQFSQKVLYRNTTLNLTRVTDEREFIIKHLVDSLSVLPLLREVDAARIVDIGTGGGFPGMILKIAEPTLRVSLVEAANKKVAFLQGTLEEMGLTGVDVQWGRAETIAHHPSFHEAFDAAVSRAVADLRVLVELALPFVKLGGILIAQKGPGCEREIGCAENALSELGGGFEKTVRFELPEALGSRALVVIRKHRASAAKYPRKAGMPQKKPL